MRSAVLVLLTAMGLSANVATVTFDGPATGVNNGTDYVLPYDLTVDGQPVLADCYDFFDQISTGETWQANEDTLAQADATGMFAGNLTGYEMVGVMSTMSAPTPQSQIDLQEAMWNVFDPGAFVVTAGMAADNATAAGEIAGFNFSVVRYLEPVLPPSGGVKADVAVAPPQPFVFDVPKKLEFTPEPWSAVLMGLGLVVVGVWRRRVS